MPSLVCISEDPKIQACLNTTTTNCSYYSPQRYGTAPADRPPRSYAHAVFTSCCCCYQILPPHWCAVSSSWHSLRIRRLFSTLNEPNPLSFHLLSRSPLFISNISTLQNHTFDLLQLPVHPANLQHLCLPWTISTAQALRSRPWLPLPHQKAKASASGPNPKS